MKRVILIILISWVFSINMKAPENPVVDNSNEYYGLYLTEGFDMRFTIYPEDYHSRKIKEILDN